VRGADNSYRGVIPSEVCPMSVIAKPLKGEAVTRNRLEAPQEKGLNEMYFFHDCMSVVGVRLLNHTEKRCTRSDCSGRFTGQLQTHNNRKRKTSISPARFELAIPACERP